MRLRKQLFLLNVIIAVLFTILCCFKAHGQDYSVNGTVLRLASSALPTSCNNGDVRYNSSTPTALQICDSNAWTGLNVWGSIVGTLSNQTDLNTALGLKAPLASPTFTGTVTTPLSTAGLVLTSSGGVLSSLANGSNTNLLTISSGTPAWEAIPTWNQNTTGTAANITSTSNSTLTTLSALSSIDSSVTGNYFIASPNGSTGAMTPRAFVTADLPTMTNGQLIIGKTSSAPVITTLTQGSGITITNGAGTVTIAASNSGAPNAQYNGYYQASGSNYWSNTTTGSSYGNFSATGTIPSPTVNFNTGFTTPTLPSGSLPGITFTAPYTGTLYISFSLTASSAPAENVNFQLWESSTSTEIDNIFVQLPQLDVPYCSLSGYFAVTASTSYTVVIRSTSSGGTATYINAGGQTSNVSSASMLTMRMHYIH
jgi:hypothetical protein